MRKLIVSLLTVSALIVGLNTVQAQPKCQDINLSNQSGSFVGTFCVDMSVSPNTITLDGTAAVKATGKSYVVTADATVAGTQGNYTAAGSVTVSLPDGTVVKTFTFSSPGMTPVMAETGFVSKAIGSTLSLTAPRPTSPFPFRPRMTNMN